MNVMKLYYYSALFFLFAFTACTKKDVTNNTTKDSYTLPDDRFFPEGIAYDAAAGVFYTGSTVSGNILRVNVSTGETSLFSNGAAQGRSFCTGMKLDSKGRLWVCGGGEAKIHLLSTQGYLIKTWDVKTLFGGLFINDCIGDNEYMYFTDSQTPKIYRAKVTEDQPGELEEWLTFTNAQIPYVAGTNANGIEMTKDGKYLIVVISTSGKLYRIDKATKAVSEITLNATVQSGDGLLLDGNTLYVSRNATNQIFPVALNADYTQGTVGAGFGSNLIFNTTMAKVGDNLLVVNGQLNRRTGTTPPVLPFSITRVSIPK
jgi:Cu-Zn family superoxide dismutase